MTTRRAFLKIGAAAGGGMLVGFSLPGCVHGERGAVSGGVAKFNAWLRITPDDVYTFVLDRVEMGQGTLTASAMMLSEELELDPKRLEIEMAPVDPAYNNRLFFVQATGGSMSTASSWPLLRQAGATAREMLRTTAAKTWGVPLSSVVAHDGTLRSGKHHSTYGALASKAAYQRVHRPALKKRADWKLIGTEHQRLDAQTKVDGSAVFGMDVRVPGMLVAVVARSPVIGGEMVSVDDAAARAVKGVEHIVRIPSGVAVVAKKTWQAIQGARALKVRWSAGSAPELSDASLSEAHAALMKEEGVRVASKGDAAGAIEGATTTVHARYEVPYVAHAPMEPMNATAWVKANSCEIWAPTQSNVIAREVAGRILAMPVENIRVHTPYIGGGFGRRSMVDYVEEAVHISKATGTPVKVVWSREDDLQNGWLRPRVTAEFEAVLEDGKPTAWRNKLVGQSVLGSVAQQLVGAIPPEWLGYVVQDYLAKKSGKLFREGKLPDITTLEGAAHIPYDIAHQDVRFVQHEPKVPVTFWRSVGHSFNGFLVESFIDELAHAAKADPYRFRMALLQDHPRHRAVLERAASEAGWDKPAPEGVFRGIAQHGSFGSFTAEVAEVSVDDGQLRVRRVVCAVDCGTVVNPDIVRAQAEGGIIFGLSSALKHAIHLEGGRIRNSNFHDFPVLRMHESPVIETHIIASDEEPTGIGEVTLPPIAAAVANAIFAATGKRLRSLPLEQALREAS